jgi:hypothetical protein
MNDLKIKSLLDCERKDMKNMTEDQSMVFMTAMMAEKKMDELPDELLDWPIQLMVARLKPNNIPVSLWTLFFLSSLCPNRFHPAKLVMYAHACVEIYKKVKEEVNIEHVANEFPFGFPSDKAMREIWEGQKGFNNQMDCDNILDTPESWMVEGERDEYEPYERIKWKTRD